MQKSKEAAEGEVSSHDPFDAIGREEAAEALNQQQRLLQQNVDRRVDQALAIRNAATEAEADRLVQQAGEHGSMVACLGPPGPGKTFVADLCIRRAVAAGARVLYALPTGQLSARMRQRHPDIEVDTCHGAFLLHRPAAESMAILSQYDLVVVDEAFQLSQGHFERVDEMFRAAGKQPCVLLLGDPWQLPSVEPRNAIDSPRWQYVKKVRLHTVWRCKCPLLAAKLAALRHSKPMGTEGTQLVSRICRGHLNTTLASPQPTRVQTAGHAHISIKSTL